MFLSESGEGRNMIPYFFTWTILGFLNQFLPRSDKKELICVFFIYIHIHAERVQHKVPEID
jgi:hypothetical protein